jgi:hypothetical protein
MFSDVTPGQSGVPSGIDRDVSKPEFRSRLLAIAKRRDQNPTDDVAAVFKEGERAPVAGASI